MNKTTLNSKTAIECHTALQKLANHNVVRLWWVKGHMGIWGNEEADKLAKKGTTCEITDEGYLPQSLIKRKVKERIVHLDDADWATKAPRRVRLSFCGATSFFKFSSFLRFRVLQYFS